MTARKTTRLPNFLTILGIFFIMLSGSLLVVYFNNNKRYDASLENRLEMRTLPSDVKSQIDHANAPANFRVPVLIYHYVEYVRDKKDKTRLSLNITPDIFEAQISALDNAGYTFMTASELGKILDGDLEMPKKPILITFDDGHRDFYTDAYPILKKYDAKSTAYIISDFLGGSDFMYNYQIQELANSGIVEIGDHTLHHAYLKGDRLENVQEEVYDSKVELQKEFNIPVVSFAYPYGAFDTQAIEVVKKAGFTTAMSTLPGVNLNNSNRYFIERIRPGVKVGDDLINFLENYKQPEPIPTKPQD